MTISRAKWKPPFVDCSPNCGFGDTQDFCCLFDPDEVWAFWVVVRKSNGYLVRHETRIPERRGERQANKCLLRIKETKHILFLNKGTKRSFIGYTAFERPSRIGTHLCPET